MPFIAHLFGYIHPTGYEVVFHCGLISISLMTYDVEHFSCAYQPLYIFLGEMSVLFKYFAYLFL
jgi:hypothetical protein